jgi:two-component system sensor kinase FixL
MAGQALARRSSGEVVEFARFGRNDANPLRPVAHDAARRLRLEALEMLAPMLIHELAQPLAATNNYINACAMQVRRDAPGLEDVIAGLERAKAQVMRAGEIIRSMRDFALRGEVAGRPEGLRGIVNEALAAVPEMQTVDVSLCYHAARVDVIVDRVLFRQVLTNLFTNAVEAMRDCPDRRLRIVTSEVDRDCTQIRIEDSGPGLGWDVFGRLYEQFVTTKPTGTGLGLPICNAIVAAHGGRLWASQPEAGRGAVFNMLVPNRIKVEAL